MEELSVYVQMCARIQTYFSEKSISDFDFCLFETPRCEISLRFGQICRHMCAYYIKNTREMKSLDIIIFGQFAMRNLAISCVYFCCFRCTHRCHGWP